MTSTKLTRYAAAPILVLGIGLFPAIGCSDAAGIAEGCPEFTAGSDWGASLDIDYKVRAFMGAAGSFQVLGEEMVNDVFIACEGIAKATKRDSAKWSSLEGAKRVEAVCAEADAGIKAIIAANANVKLVALVEGGRCEASLNAAAECNAKCDVSGKCTPGQLEATCEPGQLAGKCEAECSGACTADVGATVDCQGSCSATCTGECAGNCAVKGNDGKCAGRCEGTCNGSCSGTCEVAANANVECKGTCRGECSVDFKAPHCEGKVEPPACDLDADCEASCQAEVQAEATCTPPKVTIQVDGGNTDDVKALVAALETHLPALLTNIGARGEAAVDSVKTLANVSGNLKGAITSSGKAFVCFTDAAAAAVAASVNVNVSVQASVNVSASAAGSVN